MITPLSLSLRDIRALESCLVATRALTSRVIDLLVSTSLWTLNLVLPHVCILMTSLLPPNAKRGSDSKGKRFFSKSAPDVAKLRREKWRELTAASEVEAFTPFSSIEN